MPEISKNNYEIAPPAEARADLSDFWPRLIKSEADIEAQKKWQAGGSPAERQAKIFFDHLAIASVTAGKAGEISLPKPTGMPESDFLAGEIVHAAVNEDYESAEAWRREIENLKHYQTAQGEINILKLLANANISASVRQEFWEKEMAGIFDYCRQSDLVRLADEKEIEKLRQQQEKEKTSDPLQGDELPPPSADEIDTSMDEIAESEGEPKGYFSVHPFWGGYYREEVFERHVGGSRWAKESRQYRPAEAIKVEDKKIYRGVAPAGQVTALPLPYGFKPDVSSLKSGENIKLMIDGNDNYILDAQEIKNNAAFTVSIGCYSKAAKTQEASKSLAVAETHAGEEAEKFLKELPAADSVIVKARKIKGFVSRLLTYANESRLNAAYQSHPQGYFAAIEEYKQADCDVANAYYINLLSLVGIKARLAVGHYVKNKDSRGAAALNSGTRHAWTEVWDELSRQWIRFDATPPHDPTLDDERPDELPEDEPQPGDFGEQEAAQLSDEQLAELRKNILAAQEQLRQIQESPEEKIDREFAREAGCSVEEARVVINRIEAARRLKDKKGRVIRDYLAGEFQKIVESNFRPREVFKGPVKRSEGEELDDLVMAGKEILTKESDPLGYVVLDQELKKIQEYGGFDIYFVADRSGSMAEIDPVSQKPKKDEQQLAEFLILDSLFAFGEKARTASSRGFLISPLSVRSSLVAFGAGNAGTLKELSNSWTKKQQYDAWKGLESNIGGGTPAHLGLKAVREAVEKDIEREKKSKKPAKKRLRLAMTFMDGGVDNKNKYLSEQKELEDLGVYVTSWGLTASARAVEAYPGGHCVESVRDIIEPVVKEIIEKAAFLKLKKRHD